LQTIFQIPFDSALCIAFHGFEAQSQNLHNRLSGFIQQPYLSLDRISVSLLQMGVTP
jgi:hypothetical protein